MNDTGETAAQVEQDRDYLRDMLREAETRAEKAEQKSEDLEHDRDEWHKSWHDMDAECKRMKRNQEFVSDGLRGMAANLRSMIKVES